VGAGSIGSEKMVIVDNRAKAMLEVEDIHLNFGKLKALAAVTLDVKEGEILAVIGPNGAGKTCLLNCVSGLYRPQKGDIFLKGAKLLHYHLIRLLRSVFPEPSRMLSFSPV
jgi:ABC-type branched-subunit amino acid transport system ATPase component